jgi:hypothetical protein
MADNVLGPLWKRATSWFYDNAQRVTAEFIADPGGTPVHAYEGYLRIWLAEGFLSNAATWGNRHFPVLHGGAAVTFLDSTTPFTTFARPPGTLTVPGAQLDFPLTPLLPFNGGVVEVEASLYQASTTGPLVTALRIVGSFDALLAPPLSLAATVAGKVADGVDDVLGTDQPVLGVHWAMVAPGGGGNTLRPGSLAVVSKPRDALGGSLSVQPNLGLCVNDGHGPRQLTGADYLLLRIECRRERDDWRFPELDELIRAAGRAAIKGYEEVFRDCRTEAITRAWNSTDLTPADRTRVAVLVASEIDATRKLGAVPGPDQSLAAAAADRLPAPDAPELQGLALSDLLG